MFVDLPFPPPLPEGYAVTAAAPYPPHLVDALSRSFDAATVQRGLAYAVEGRAQVEGVKRSEDGGLEVAGVCQGSLKKPYRQTLWLAKEDDGRVFYEDSTCNCPVGDDCKHIVALLLTVLKDGGASLTRSLDGEDDDEGDEGAAATATDEFPEPSAEALGWLEGLDAPAPAPAAVSAKPAAKGVTGSYQLVYLLRTGFPGHPVQLALGKSRIMKTGGFGKPAPYRPQAYDLGGYRGPRDVVGESDVEPLRLFLALQAGGSFYYNDSVELRGEPGALLLRQAQRSGRLFLDGRMEDALRLAESRPLALAWKRNEAGLQELSVDLPPTMRWMPTWPLTFLDSAECCVGELHSELPPALLQQLIQAPPLNEADAPLARQRLQHIARERAIDLPLPQAAETESAGKPEARLVLTQGRFRHRVMSATNPRHAIAELYFDYPQGIIVSGAAEPSPLLRHRDADGQWRSLQRDLEAEAAVWRLLQQFDLESTPSRLPNFQRLDATEEGLMPSRFDASGWLPLLSDGMAALEAAGVQVTISDDFPFSVAEADDWFVQVDEDEIQGGGEWFNLDLGVSVGGERISLVQPLLGLIREQAGLLARVRALDDSQTYPVALDEHRILPVPAGRLKAWLLPLLEFLDDERPRLSRHHAITLAGLEEQPAHWVGGETLRALGQKLKDFSGIESRPPAPGFNATLRPYQQLGLDWLQFLREYGLAGILADDMGLGKTVQTLAHIHLEKTEGRADRPSLVIAPTSLLANWRNEAAQFAPNLKVLTLHGPDRARNFAQMAEVDIIVTTYPLLVRDRDVLLAQEYHLLVMDEAQFIKNPKAQSHQVARQLKARHRLSLTGTPLENHLGELWAQFDFLMPGFLGKVKRFAQVFRVPIEKQGDNGARQELAERVRPFLLRRTKEQVLTDLPPRTEMVRWVEIDGGQRDLYESLRVVFDKKLRQALAEQGVGRSQIMILDALLKLRQVCCDPRLVKLPAAENLVSKGTAASAKLQTLMEMLEELIDEGRKVLLFSQFTSMIELIEAELEVRKITYAKLTGQTRDRETPIADFQEGRVPLFLISLKAGGTGLNLTAADTVIHYDPWWNPAVEEQATARAHRIGQEKPVFVYKLLTQGTVEEKILALQDRKRGLADQLLKQKAPGEDGGGHLLTAADLDVLFQPLGS